MNEALIKLAIQAQTDPDARPVLGDMLIENGMAEGPLHSLASALLLGVPLDHEIPERLDLRGNEARTRWRKQRRDSMKVAEQHWSAYAASCSSHWARAVLAVLLFGHWRPATSSTQGPWRLRTRSPWPLIREPANRAQREIDKNLRIIPDPKNYAVMSVARRYGAGT